MIDWRIQSGINKEWRKKMFYWQYAICIYDQKVLLVIYGKSKGNLFIGEINVWERVGGIMSYVCMCVCSFVLSGNVLQTLNKIAPFIVAVHHRTSSFHKTFWQLDWEGLQLSTQPHNPWDRHGV